MAKKKTLLGVVCLAMVALIAVFGTVAYLTDRDSETNVFTSGDVAIELKEDFKQGAELLPGVDVNKDAWIKNTGENDAYVWMTIAVPSSLDRDLAYENALHFNYPKDSVGDGLWTWYQKDSNNWNVAKEQTIADDPVKYNIYTVMYQSVLKPGEETPFALTNVYLDKAVDVDPDGKWYKVVDGNATDLEWNNNMGNPKIYVAAYAIQAENFADVYAAYEAYGTQWGSNNNVDYGTVELFSYEDVNYVTVGDTAQVNSTGGTIVYRGILSDGKSTVANVVIGEGIERLNNRAICKAPSIVSVSLPVSLTYIDESVFQQSGSITSIEIPENVTYIGKQAFGGCGSLETIVINAKNVTIANYVARACANLKEVYIYSDTVTFESGSMYFTNKENGDASGITFYVQDQAMADNLYAAFSTSHSYGLLIKNLDGSDVYYNTLK